MLLYGLKAVSRLQGRDGTEQNPVVLMNTGDIDECLGKWKQPELTEQNTREKRMSQRTL